jgi:hypothetical protein
MEEFTSTVAEAYDLSLFPLLLLWNLAVKSEIVTSSFPKIIYASRTAFTSVLDVAGRAVRYGYLFGHFRTF